MHRVQIYELNNIYSLIMIEFHNAMHSCCFSNQRPPKEGKGSVVSDLCCSTTITRDSLDRCSSKSLLDGRKKIINFKNKDLKNKE